MTTDLRNGLEKEVFRYSQPNIECRSIHLLEPGTGGLKGAGGFVGALATAHLDEELQGGEPLAAILQSRNEAAAGHHIRLDAVLLHLLKNLRS